jgi:hypothetical protein
MSCFIKQPRLTPTRRLAAATGNPPGIQDEAIRVGYPDDFPGFTHPAALNVNISIAKTTGQILQGKPSTSLDKWLLMSV